MQLIEPRKLEPWEWKLLKYVVIDEGCWAWAGWLHTDGYGAFTVTEEGYTGPRTVYAHRFMYEYAWGPIPEGLQVDHLCRNRICCNPWHLEAVTPQINRYRGTLRWCKRGHDQEAPGVRYHYNSNGKRRQRCGPCYRAQLQKMKESRTP